MSQKYHGPLKVEARIPSSWTLWAPGPFLLTHNHMDVDEEEDGSKEELLWLAQQ